MGKRLGSTDNFGPSLTRQSDASECDVNNIMKRYEKTGMLPPYANPGFFADVSAMGDFRQVVDTVAQTSAIFEQFPAAFRAEFDNDVATFVNWATDPANAGELKSLLEQAPKAPVDPAAAAAAPGEAPAGA